MEVEVQEEVMVMVVVLEEVMVMVVVLEVDIMDNISSSSDNWLCAKTKFKRIHLI